MMWAGGGGGGGGYLRKALYDSSFAETASTKRLKKMGAFFVRVRNTAYIN